MNISKHVPTIILGAGPAGLASGIHLTNAVVLESGNPLEGREHHDIDNLLSGVGGAGLYSDGKFSFYPAATQLWKLPEQDTLHRAQAWLNELLNTQNIHPPKHSSSPNIPPAFKQYPSMYLDLNQRQLIIDALSKALGDRLYTQRQVIDVQRIDDETLVVSWRDHKTNTHGQWSTNQLICAGGRFAPLFWIDATASLPMTFYRMEVGVRIEGPHDHAFFRSLKQRAQSIDPKLILTHDHGEYRTFCFCDKGQLALTTHQHLRTYSGRADGPVSERSNVGFNIRLLHADAPNLSTLGELTPFAVKHNTSDTRTILAQRYKHIGQQLHDGLKQLGEHIPEFWDDGLTLYGPTVEGVGHYPSTDEHLQVRGWPIFVAGDGCGRFRGLVAALISGAYLGISRNQKR